MPHLSNDLITEARESFQTLTEMSNLLCTGLDPETLTICIRLCELGLHPDVLAVIIRELRKEVASIRNSGSSAANSNLNSQ